MEEAGTRKRLRCRLAARDRQRMDKNLRGSESAMPANVVTQLEVKSHNSPDEKRRPDKSEIDVVTVGDYTVGRFTFDPGWRWSDCIKPADRLLPEQPRRVLRFRGPRSGDHGRQPDQYFRRRFVHDSARARRLG